MHHIDPSPGLPYSAATASNSLVEVSGQIGLRDGKLMKGFEAQARQTLQNLKDVLTKAGASMKNVMKVRIYLTDMDDYRTMNEIYKEFFPSPAPARVAIAVSALPLGALIEIECTATI